MAKARYDLLVDGARRAKVGSDAEARSWLRQYRADHAEDDPDATHVQVLARSTWSFFTGGTLVPRERFLDAEPPRPSAS
jgi:hypothetical protein